MPYDFPVIHHINDVLPAIAERDEFVVGKRDGYMFIDYNYADSDSFDCPIRRECRGLKFDLDGKLIARPFHKFFNLHEKPAEIPTSWDDAVIMEKLDGSMIHPAMVNDELVFMTRAGVTEQAKMALAACKRLPLGEFVLAWCEGVLRGGATPIFEFTSPLNQIVVRYASENLTLLAVRMNDTGTYADTAPFAETLNKLGVGAVRIFGNAIQDINAFVEHTKALKDTEGYVVRVGQQLIKLKADDYVAAHRARSGLLWEKDVLRLVLENKVDDVSALLPEDEAKRLLAWRDALNWRLRIVAAIIRNGAVNSPSFVHRDRKAFAQYVRDKFSNYQFATSICFRIYDGADPLEALRQHALKQVSSTTKAREFLALLGGVEPWTATPVDLNG
jgi:RNA ligase